MAKPRKALPGGHKIAIEASSRSPGKLESMVLIASVLLAALSAFASAYAGHQTAQQAQYARQSLTAANLNTASEKFVVSFGSFCNFYDITNGAYDSRPYLKRGTPDKVVVQLRSLYFMPAIIADNAYYKRRADERRRLELQLSEALETLALWVPPNKFGYLSSASRHIMRLDPTALQGDNEIEKGLKQSGYCRFMQREMMAWLTDRETSRQAEFSATEVEYVTDPIPL